MSSNEERQINIKEMKNNNSLEAMFYECTGTHTHPHRQWQLELKCRRSATVAKINNENCMPMPNDVAVRVAHTRRVNARTTTTTETT